jgi:hypothetical protein
MAEPPVEVIYDHFSGERFRHGTRLIRWRPNKMSGRVAYAVMSFGGFMGLGHSHYPIPWSALTYDKSLGGFRKVLPIGVLPIGVERRKLQRKSLMPLHYKDRGSSQTQLEVVSGNLAVGSLRKDFKSVMSASHEVWHWTLYVGTHPGSPLPGFRHHGSGDSRETVQADLEKMWALWVEAAGLG